MECESWSCSCPEECLARTELGTRHRSAHTHRSDLGPGHECHALGFVSRALPRPSHFSLSPSPSHHQPPCALKTDRAPMTHTQSPFDPAQSMSRLSPWPTSPCPILSQSISLAPDIDIS